jgi:hypothetical protein
MLMLRMLAVMLCISLVLGCGGEAGSKSAVPSANAAPKPPGGGTTATGEGAEAPPATAMETVQ